MATQAQIQANRSNAQKSTGPCTAEGKAVVAQNAVKHGLCGREVVIVGEDPGEFESYRARMLAELDPVGEVESDLAERIVGLSWRLKRVDRLQATAFDSLYARQKHSVYESSDSRRDVDGDSTFGRALVRDFGDARVIDRLSMYERRIEHSLYRTMAQLQRHRILSEVGPGKMWELRRALAREDSKEEPSAESGAEREHREPARSVPVRAYLPSEEDKITPDGVTTNEDGRDARATEALPESTCKTKPISPAPDLGQDPCNTALTADSPRNGPAETKPILGTEEVSSLELQVSSGDLPLQTSGFASCTPGG